MYKMLCRNLLRHTNSMAKTTKTIHCRQVVSSADIKNKQNNYCLVSIDNKSTNFLRRKMSSSTENPITSEAGSSAEAASTSSSKITNARSKYTNRLISEKSPYLLQHANNPVDWYPWGDEALERARKENKVIFLSVGYSTCHWCHVMEHESFEDEEVAKIMNEHFINIKVDREERPDIDKIYMQFLVLTNGGGGWPMSVWLTPDLMPITSGTYFPPVQRYGMPAFRTALTTVAEKWQANQTLIRANGLKIVDIIKSSMKNTTSNQEQSAENSADVKLEEAIFLYKNRYDASYGGFGLQPKFPEIPRLSLLFHAYVINKDEHILDMALKTLQKISHGGIHDHLGGGFSRYAVDNIWHVPHFEKMLYDQGQLMSAYATAYKLTGDVQYLQAAEGIYSYIMRDLRHEAGGFYAGEDADSLPTATEHVKIEGAFYAWTWQEIVVAIKANTKRYEIAGEKHKIDDIIKIYAEHYDLKETGNVSAVHDPHHHFVGKNIFIMRNTVHDICHKFHITAEQLEQIVKITNEILLELRVQRPRPHLDNKIICSWNALMLAGLCDLASCNTPASATYLKTAKELFNFIRKNLYVAEQEILLHACYGAPDKGAELDAGSRIEGFLDDYAFFINALINYYKLTLDFEVLQWASALQRTQHRLFWDDSDGGYFYSKADANDLVLRLKGDHDGAEPGGNSVAARNLIILSNYFDEKSYAQQAKDIFHYYSDNASFGYSLPQMMSALLLLEHGMDIVAVVGIDDASIDKYLQILRSYYVPGLILYELKMPKEEVSKDNRERLARLEQKFKMIDGKTTVYICHNRVCRLPITDTIILEGVLKENYFLDSH